MEKWSRYNYVFESPKYGNFIYNARTNSFIKINDTLYHIIKEKDIDINKLSALVKKTFLKHKILVEEGQDDTYFYNKKFLFYSRTFSQKTLGLTIATTTHCNFRCHYCYEEGVAKSISNKKTNDAIIKFIENNPAKTIDIIWYGGEPLLNFKAIEYLTGILKNDYNGKKISYSIITNGYLLTKRIVALFKKYNLESIQITIDGTKEEHNKTRILANGRGSFDIIMRNLRFAVNELPNCNFAIRMNCNMHNIQEYPDLVNFIRTEFGNNKNVSCYHSFIKDYSKINARCVSHREAFDINKSLYLDHSIKNNISFYPEFNANGCSANNLNGFVIGPEGNLYKCWVDIGKRERAIGTIFENSNEQFNTDLLSQYMVNSDMYDNPKCKKCFLFPACGGGCPYERLAHPNTPDCIIAPSLLNQYLELYYETSYE